MDTVKKLDFRYSITLSLKNNPYKFTSLFAPSL